MLPTSPAVIAKHVNDKVMKAKNYTLAVPGVFGRNHATKTVIQPALPILDYSPGLTHDAAPMRMFKL